jgi:hypothetical protein
VLRFVLDYVQEFGRIYIKRKTHAGYVYTAEKLHIFTFVIYSNITLLFFTARLTRQGASTLGLEKPISVCRLLHGQRKGFL